MPTHDPGRVIEVDDSITSTEEMAEQLKEISKQMKKLLNGRLTEKGIIILIRELLPKGSKISPQKIKDVLKAASNLDEYVQQRDSTPQSTRR